jgi:hypothetical protein
MGKRKICVAGKNFQLPIHDNFRELHTSPSHKVLDSLVVLVR